jgi:hypothetical protein
VQIGSRSGLTVALDDPPEGSHGALARALEVTGSGARTPRWDAKRVAANAGSRRPRRRVRSETRAGSRPPPDRLPREAPGAPEIARDEALGHSTGHPRPRHGWVPFRSRSFGSPMAFRCARLATSRPENAIRSRSGGPGGYVGGPECAISVARERATTP